MVVVILVLELAAFLFLILTAVPTFKWFRTRQAGLAEWNARALTLPWRDRLALHWANMRGSTVEPRLAPLAVQRGRALLQVHTRMEQDSDWRRSRNLVRIFVALYVARSVGRAIRDGGTLAWLVLGLSLLLGGLVLADPVFIRRTARRIEQSIALNQAVVEESRE